MLRKVARGLAHLADRAPVELPRRGRVRRRVIADLVGNPEVVVEVGAHKGVDTAAMARLWPQAQIHAFEPLPELIEQARLRTRSLGNVHIHEWALSDQQGTADMYVSGGGSDASSSLLRPKEHLATRPDVTFSKRAAIQVSTLDASLAMYGVERAEFLWLDAQGNELRVLRGGEAALTTVRGIYTEVSLKENFAGGVLYPELKEWLSSRGFRPAIEKLAWADGGNVLFVRDAGC